MSRIPTIRRGVVRSLSVLALGAAVVIPFAMTASPASAATKTVYSCPSGGTLYGKLCTTFTDQAPTSAITYTCPKGTLTAGTCADSIPAVSQSQCEAVHGDYLGYYCILYYLPNSTATCAQGTFSVKTCVVSSSYPAVATKVTTVACKKGKVGKTFNGSTCPAGWKR